MNTETGLHRDQVSILQNYREVAFALPDPDEEFTRRDLPAVAKRHYRKFLNVGVLIQVDTILDEDYEKLGVYRVTEPAAEYIETLERPWTLPCGHSGIHNYGAGEYGCGEPTCEERFERGTVETALPTSASAGEVADG